MGKERPAEHREVQGKTVKIALAVVVALLMGLGGFQFATWKHSKDTTVTDHQTTTANTQATTSTSNTDSASDSETWEYDEKGTLRKHVVRSRSKSVDLSQSQKTAYESVIAERDKTIKELESRKFIGVKDRGIVVTIPGTFQDGRFHMGGIQGGMRLIKPFGIGIGFSVGHDFKTGASTVGPQLTL